MKYVTSFVMPVQKKKIDLYRKTARKFAKLWKEHGALEVVETVAEDVKKGKLTSFPRSVQLKRNETVVVSWVTFKSRKHRDTVMAKVMGDPRAQKLMNPDDMPGDGHRKGVFTTAVRHEAHLQPDQFEDRGQVEHSRGGPWRQHHAA